MYRIFALVAAALFAATSPLQAQRGLFVTTTDFATGSTAFLAPGATEAEVNLLGIHADATGHYHDGRVYVVNRLGQDNILVLDAADLRSPLTQFSVGNGANPHDIEIVAPDKAYVTRYDGTALGEIDLSAFADGDGLPEMAQMALVGERLYVACLLLDRNNGWIPATRGLLAVIDTATDQVIDIDPLAAGVQAWPLASGNPVSHLPFHRAGRGSLA